MIYICIPSHNEERTLGILLWKIRQVLTAFPRDYQLLVLDDGSDDATAEVLAPYARILPLTVLHHPRALGYAASLDELVREAVARSEYPRRDVVLTLQADFTEEPDAIPALLKRIESGADVVTTRAHIAPEHAPRKIRWLRNGLLRLLRGRGWPEGVTDVLSGLRAYRVMGLRKAIEALGNRRLVEWDDIWAANAALLRAVAPHVRRIDEVEASFRPDRRQRSSRFDAWATARQVTRFALGRPPGVPVPARQGAGPIVVTAAELAAAAREARPLEEAPTRRRGRARAGEAAPTERRSEPEGGRGRRGKEAGQGEPRERQPAARGEKAERTKGRAAASRADTVDGAAATASPAPAKSRRRKRGAAAAAEQPAAADSEQVLEPVADATGVETAIPEGPTADGTEAAGAPAERKRRRRSSRRGRGKRERAAEPSGADAPAGPSEDGAVAPTVEAVSPDVPGVEWFGEEAAATPEEAAADGAPEEVSGEAGEAPRKRRRSRRGGRGRSRRKAAAETGLAPDAGDENAGVERQLPLALLGSGTWSQEPPHPGDGGASAPPPLLAETAAAPASGEPVSGAPPDLPPPAPSWDRPLPEPPRVEAPAPASGEAPAPVSSFQRTLPPEAGPPAAPPQPGAPQADRPAPQADRAASVEAGRPEAPPASYERVSVESAPVASSYDGAAAPASPAPAPPPPPASSEGSASSSEEGSFEREGQ